LIDYNGDNLKMVNSLGRGNHLFENDINNW